jgi:hypothetical protein
MSYEIAADTEKNRLLITMTGCMSDEELKDAADAVIREAEKLRPGFSTINDIRAFKPATEDGAAEIVRAQKFLSDHGVGHVVRVIGERSLASLQLKRTQTGAGYIADHVATMEEAFRILDEEEKNFSR